MSENVPAEYDFQERRILPLNAVAFLLEGAQKIPGIHEVMQEPFDITNHGGNMCFGTGIASITALTYAIKNSIDEDGLTINEESMNRFRKYGIAMACGATALVNGITETKWGVKHLPVAEWLGGRTPDVLDTLYSTAWAGVASVLLWRKRS